MVYKLEIELDAYQRLQAYANAVKGEIGGLGRVTLDAKAGVFTLTEVFLLEQTASGAECELSAEGVAKLYTDLLEEGKDVDDIKLWWHSHSDMKSFFSGTDVKTMNEWPGDWLVGLVINKESELEARYQIQKPLILYISLETEVLLPEFKGEEEIKAEVKAKVTPAVITYTSTQVVKGQTTTQWQNPSWNKVYNKENDPQKSHHRMTDDEYQQLMEEEYISLTADIDENAQWSEWIDRYIRAEALDNNLLKISLVEEALHKGILDEDEADVYLN